MIRTRATSLKWAIWVSAALAAIVALQPVRAQGGRPARAATWVATWAAAPAWRVAPIPPPAPPPASAPGPAAAPSSSAMPGLVVPIDIANQTLRQIVRTRVAGDRVRVVFSNEFGTAPLSIGGAHIALRGKGSSVVAGSGRPLRFSGEPSATVPAGAALVSDDVALTVAADVDLAIDLYMPGDTARSTSPVTWHQRSYQTSYVSRPGNHLGAEDLPVAATTLIWHWLTRVEVSADPESFAVITVGDSITDGFGSDFDTNTRWPDELARRLRANPRTRHASVLNMGIGGNRLLGHELSGFGVNALARFDRDVLAQPRVRYVIVLEGINDIGFGAPRAVPSAAALIAAHRQLIARAHAHGITMIGGTLTPFEGANYWTAEGEASRKGVNDWIRTSGEYDGVIDFDAAVRDAKQPNRFDSRYHVGDLLHPNSAGYKVMAAAVDLKLFERHRRSAVR